MKKLRRILVLALAALFVLGAFVGCQKPAEGGQTENVTEENKTDETAENGSESEKTVDVKVGIAAPDVTHGWVAGVAYYAEKYCKEKNLTYKITTSSDAAEMMGNLNDLVTWGASVIVAWPQWTGMEDAVSEIIAQGIPVVNFDVDVDCEGVYKVTGNNYDMGYQSAKYITEKVGDAASIVVLDVPSAGSVSELRKQGFYDYLNEVGYDQSGIFEISEEGFSRDIALKDMTDVLESHDQIDAVFSMDDETSIGAIQAITEAGRTDIKAITGGGGMQEYFRMMLEDQYASLGLASALYSPSMVEYAVQTAIDLQNGVECPAQIVIPTTIVTAENAEEFIDANNTVY